MTPAQAARKLEAIANRLKREGAKALVRTANQGVTMAKVYSSGSYSLATLAAMGHPYAVRNPGNLPAWLINRQTGQFQSAWKAEPVRSTLDGHMSAFVVNASPVAGFLAGRNRPRSRMIRRPIDDEVRDDLRPVLKAEVRKAIRRAIRGRG